MGFVDGTHQFVFSGVPNVHFTIVADTGKHVGVLAMPTDVFHDRVVPFVNVFGVTLGTRFSDVPNTNQFIVRTT